VGPLVPDDVALGATEGSPEPAKHRHGRAMRTNRTCSIVIDASFVRCEPTLGPKISPARRWREKTGASYAFGGRIAIASIWSIGYTEDPPGD
jgi:hypothetical protein